MMRQRTDYLFQEAHLSDVLRAQVSAIPERVQGISEAVIRASSDEELAEQIAEDLDILPLKLLKDRATMDKEEVQVDVSHDRRRAFLHDSRGPLLIPGIRVRVSVPYEGDSELWRFRPSTFRLTAPRGTVRKTGPNCGTLSLTFEQPADESPALIKQQLDSLLDDINFTVGNQANDLRGLREQLRREGVKQIQARRSRLQRHDSLSDVLGIPEGRSTSMGLPKGDAPKIRSSSSPVPSPAVQPESWDVFVSHASEDKNPFVRELVGELKSQGLNVWFDEFALTLGDSLRRSIDKGLAKSRFGIVVISKAFLSKEWPQRELDGLIAREDDGRKVILPIWHEITAPEVRAVSPMLADRLAVPSSRGVKVVVEELLRVLRPTKGA